MSGAKLERPGLQSALRAARAGRFDLLLVYRVDRLARSVRGLAEVLETLDAAGAGFRSATEPFDTTSPAGRMMVQMLGVFAEFERATIIDRVIAGMERKSSQGGWCGGTHPFGYRAVKGEGRLEVDEDEAPLIPVIFDLYANKRLGSHAIANQLTAAGLSTRSGRPWQFKSILTVVRNRTTSARSTSGAPGATVTIRPWSNRDCSMPPRPSWSNGARKSGSGHPTVRTTC
jgi:site-specific DNA recombinase